MRVKVVAAVHFVLLVLSMQDHWVPSAYLFYNIIFILTLVWSINSPLSIEAIHFASLIDFASFLFDLLCIIKNFPDYGGVFSLVFAIINLVARPFSLLLLNRELVERGGTFMPSSNRVQQTYEDIDRPNQSVPTPAQDLHI